MDADICEVCIFIKFNGHGGCIFVNNSPECLEHIGQYAHHKDCTDDKCHEDCKIAFLGEQALLKRDEEE